MADRSLCPHPQKVTYASKAAAKLALRRSSLHGRDSLHAYRCEAGHYHLGHKVGYRGGVKEAESTLFALTADGADVALRRGHLLVLLDRQAVAAQQSDSSVSRALRLTITRWTISHCSRFARPTPGLGVAVGAHAELAAILRLGALRTSLCRRQSSTQIGIADRVFVRLRHRVSPWGHDLDLAVV